MREPQCISMPEKNGSSFISPRITDQSSTIHSDSLHTDNNWNNWTWWKFWFILFSIRSNVTGQHDWQDERLTGQLPNQSGHCLLTAPYRHKTDLCWTTLPCLLQGTLITLYSAQQFNKNIATQWNIVHAHVPFNILLWIKTVWFECKLSCISDVYSAWMWSAVHNLKSLYPFTLIILLSL